MRPELVLRARRLFHIRPSSLDAGEKRILLTAQAITDGKREARWGHHAAAVIQRYCAFTANPGEAPLPWQELLEDEQRYDGVEGVAARTGNRPLGTTRRYPVDKDMLRAELEQDARTLAECAAAIGVPEQFLTALLNGDWPTVSETTAVGLQDQWGANIISPLASSQVPADASASEQPTSAGKRKTYFWIRIGAATIVAIWILFQALQTTPQPSEEVVGYWDYDGLDGQQLVNGLVLFDQPGSGLGISWQKQLQLKNHADLPARSRALWPVVLHRETRRVCANYPEYPKYSAYIDMPDSENDGIYQFGPCN